LLASNWKELSMAIGTKDLGINLSREFDFCPTASATISREDTVEIDFEGLRRQMREALRNSADTAA